jgi:hypothetical protein
MDDDPKLAQIKANRMAQLQVHYLDLFLLNFYRLGRPGVKRKCAATKRDGRAARNDEE